MNRNKRVLILAALLLVVSCTTMDEKSAVKKALKLTENLNKAQADKLTAESLKPLLFDTELLYTEKLIHALWSGLAKSAYRIENPVVTEITAGDPESYKIFAETWEAETFYKKYAPEESWLVTVTGEENRQMIFLLNRNLKDKYSIAAYKVVK